MLRDNPAGYPAAAVSSLVQNNGPGRGIGTCSVSSGTGSSLRRAVVVY